MSTQNLSFPQWMSDWADSIEQFQRFSKSPLPDSPAGIHADLNETTGAFPTVGELLADVDLYILTLRAHYTLDVRRDPEYADLAAPERKVIVEAKLAEVLRVRDILNVTCRALHDRHFSLTGQRAFERESLRLTPQGEG